eukprot:RCo031123
MVLDLHRKKCEEEEDLEALRRPVADTITLKKSTVFWVLTFVFCLWYFWNVHMNPSDELVLFLMRATHRAVNTTAGSAGVRLPVKVRMTDPCLLFGAYPLGWVFFDQLGLRKYPNVITPNLISMIHPFLAFVAAYLFLTSASASCRAAALSSPWRRVNS